LLDVLSVVATVFLGYVVLQLQDYNSLTDFSVFLVLGQFQSFGGQVIKAQRLLGNCVGKRVVVHILGPLVGSHHVIDMIAVICLEHSAGPKLGHRCEKGEALLLQPMLILRDCEVVPDSEGHTPADVVLEGPRQRPNGSLLNSQL
jgi:hypothetical protein